MFVSSYVEKNLTELFVERVRVPAEKKMGPTFVHVYMNVKSHEAHLHPATSGAI